MNNPIQTARAELVKQRVSLLAEETKIKASGKALDAAIRALDRCKVMPDLAAKPAAIPIEAQPIRTRLKTVATGKPRGAKPKGYVKLIDFLKAGNATVDEIAEGLCIDRDRAEIIVTRAKRQGDIGSFMDRDVPVFGLIHAEPLPVAAE